MQGEGALKDSLGEHGGARRIYKGLWLDEITEKVMETEFTERKPGLIGQEENRTTEQGQRVKGEREKSCIKKFGVGIESKSRW